MAVTTTEDKFNQNTQSPRFSTKNALGFASGSSDPTTGNVIPPSSEQVSGINQPPIAAPDTTYSTPGQPRPNLAGQVAQSALGAVVGEGAKAGVKAVGRGISNFFAGASPSGVQTAADGTQFFSSAPLQQSFPATGEQSLIPGTTSVAGDLGVQAPGPVGAALNAGDFAAGAGATALGFEAAAPGIAAASVPTALAGGEVALASVPVAAEGAGFLSSLAPLVAGCFITEAVMSSGGQDTGVELETLRGFRDNIMMKTPQGQAMVAEYNAIAPIVVEAVSSRPDGIQIFQQIKSQFIDPAVNAVKSGDSQGALQIYAQMIGWVTPFAAEAAQQPEMPGQPGNAAVDQLGDHAAMVAHSPEVADGAMPDTGDDGPTMPPSGMMSPGAGPSGGSSMQQWGQKTPGIEQTFARTRY